MISKSKYVLIKAIAHFSTDERIAMLEIQSDRSEYSNVKFLTLLFGTATALVCVVDTTLAKTTAEIQSIAKTVTVEIRSR